MKLLPGVFALLALISAAGCKKKEKRAIGPETPLVAVDAAPGGPVATADAMAAGPSVDAGPVDNTDWGAAIAAAELAEPKDLQVLPVSWSGKQVVDYMKSVMNPALGVKCGFCHPKADFVAGSEHKQLAREMFVMTKEINKDFIKDKDDEVGCMTCHRGEKEPPKP